MGNSNSGGHNRKNIRTLQLQGNYIPSRHARRFVEPSPPGEITPDPPANATPSQREIWNYHMRHLAPDVIKGLDLQTLWEFVRAVDRRENAAVMLDKLNAEQTNPAIPCYCVINSAGNLMASPLIGVIEKAGHTLLRTAIELGFTPVARSRLGRAADEGFAAPPKPPKPVKVPATGWDKFADAADVRSN